VQRLFSTFPDGWPGVGLLLLRMAVGGTAVVTGVVTLAERGPTPPPIGVAVISMVAIGCGMLLLIGFLTPAVAVLVGLGSTGLTFPGCPALAAGLLEAKPSSGFVIVMSIAILLLGPGAFSLDSYLFGRREIVIEASNRPGRLE
jgi:putative oxidoreductase